MLPNELTEVALHRLSVCPLCRGAFGEVPETMTVRDPFGVSAQEFSLEKCLGCGTYVLNPRPLMSAMAPFYGPGFLADTGPRLQDRSLILRLASKQQRFNLISERRWVDRHLRESAKYLDYSAGNGQVVDAIRRHRSDVEVFATEFSSVYRQAIGKVLPIERIKESVEQFPEGLMFDLISAFAVLEHVESPVELIRALRTRLSAGGKLMLTIPNTESWQKHMTGRRWYSWMAPRHWHLMSMKTLRVLLEERGFAVLEEKHFFLRTCSSTLALSFFPFLDPLQNKSPLRMLVYACLFYLLIPAELLAAGFRRSGFMGIVARKKDGA